MLAEEQVTESFGVVVRPPTVRLDEHRTVYGNGASAQLLSLGEALLCGGAWDLVRDRFTLAIRTDPAPLLGLIGVPDEADGPRLRALGAQLSRDHLSRLRPVGWQSAAAACASLATKLEERFAEDLDGGVLVPIPRGGLIVGGMLSYLLPGLTLGGLPQGAGEVEGVCVLVDDCALSGRRIADWLNVWDGTPVVLALLHATPGLVAVLQSHDKVRDCVVAESLHDHAPAEQGDEYEAWKHRWVQRTREALWIGEPDRVLYPWNEPDMTLWNEVTGQPEPGWRLAPPTWCLKNRADRDGQALVQHCRTGPGPWKPGPAVLWARRGDNLIIVDADSGRALRLEGSAGELWEALMSTGDGTAASELLGARYRAGRRQIEEDVERFIGELAREGLLVREG